MTRRAKETGGIKAYARGQRLQAALRDCPVCKIPSDLRAEFKVARRSRISLARVLEWLAGLGYRVTAAQYLEHGRSHHETLLREVAR